MSKGNEKVIDARDKFKDLSNQAETQNTRKKINISKIWGGTLFTLLASLIAYGAHSFVNGKEPFSFLFKSEIENEGTIPETTPTPIPTSTPTPTPTLKEKMANRSITDVKRIIQILDLTDDDRHIIKVIPEGTVVCKIADGKEYMVGDNIYKEGIYRILGNKDEEEWEWECGHILESVRNKYDIFGINEQYYMTDLPEKQTNMNVDTSYYSNGNGPIIVPVDTNCLYIEDVGIIAYKDESDAYRFAWANSDQLKEQPKYNFWYWLFNGGTKIVGAKDTNSSALKGAQIQIATAVLANREEIRAKSFKEGIKVEIKQLPTGNNEYGTPINSIQCNIRDTANINGKY